MSCASASLNTGTSSLPLGKAMLYSSARASSLPTPTWGNLLNGANNSIVIQQYWWQWVFPAVIFGICTICINLIGDGLRDALDPKALER